MGTSSVLLIIILGYFALLLGIAFYTSRGSNNESFFIGNRSSKWWVVAFGMIGTSLSGITFISVPGRVGVDGFNYFGIVIGFWLGYFAVAYILLPIYYKMQLTSIYTYLERRLGNTSYKTGALFFILSRTLGATLRLYLVIKVLEAFVLHDFGISFEITAVVILALILLYTYRGGVKTIVWTDTLQTTFMLLALVVCVVYIMNSLDLSLGQTWSAMESRGYTKLFHGDLLSGNNFWKNVIGGAFMTIGMTGIDQEMMQKNISVSNLKDSQKNMVTFCFTLLIANLIFLMLGGLLYLYADAQNIVIEKADDIFPIIALKSGLPFIITVCFMIGLVSALFPSADGALTALTSSFCIDILGIKNRKDWDEQKQKKVRLIVHNTFAVIFLGCVFFFREVDNGSIIVVLLKVAGYTYGPLLALFAFGIFTKRSVNNNLVPFICIIAPVLCYFLKEYDTSLLGGYQIGYELLLINTLITYFFLYITSNKTSKKVEPINA